MKYIGYIFKIGLYFVLLALIYCILQNDYERTNKKSVAKQKVVAKLRISTAVFLSVLIASYALIGFGDIGEGDHYQYAWRFEQNVSIEVQSVFLNWIYDFLHLFTNNPYVMFFFVISLGVFLVFMGYRKYKDLTPIVLILIFFTEFFLHGFQQIKQLLANGFACLFFAYYFNNKKLKSIIFIVLAMLCHEAAYLLILIFLLLVLSKKPSISIGLLLGFSFILLYPPLLNYIFPILKIRVPTLWQQFEPYLTSNNQLKISLNYFTALKGLPIYILFVIALLNYKQGKEKIPNYLNYLILTAIAGVFVLASSYFYWLFRFSLVLYLPLCNFSVAIYDYLKEKKDLLILQGAFLVLVVLTFKQLIQMFFIHGGL